MGDGESGFCFAGEAGVCTAEMVPVFEIGAVRSGVACAFAEACESLAMTAAAVSERDCVADCA